MTLRVLAFDDLDALVDGLRRGAVAVLPTDTVPGFSCLAESPQALSRIRELKGAAAERGFVVLVASPALVEPWLDARQDAASWRFACSVWPAPVTAIVAVHGEPPGSVASPAGRTLAVRVPAHAALAALLARLGSAVVSTSVNAPGAPPLVDPGAIRSAFGGAIDILVRDDNTRVARPSTLVDCTQWPPRCVRAGDFDLDAALAGWDPGRGREPA